MTVSNTVNAFLIPHIRLLVDLGNQVDVACNVIGKPDKQLIQMGCKIHHLEFQRSIFKKDNYIAYKQIKELVLSEGYDLVHVHTPIASFLTRLACRNIPNLKILYTAHGFHFYKGAPLKNWIAYYSLERLASRWTDGIITMNEEDYALAKKMKLRKSSSAFKTNGVGINLSKFSPQNSENKNLLREKYGINKDDFILFYAAELNYTKNQGMLIEVMDFLAKNRVDIYLFLAGNGKLAGFYNKQVIKRGLEKNIIFLGYRGDVSDLLKLSDVAVSSSRREGLPVNIMEAMATGLPLIVTDCRGNRDLIKNNENGFVVGVNDVKGFARAVEQLYQSEDLRNRLREKNLSIVKRYSIEKILQEIKEIYSHYL